ADPDTGDDDGAGAEERAPLDRHLPREDDARRQIAVVGDATIVLHDDAAVAHAVHAHFDPGAQHAPAEDDGAVADATAPREHRARMDESLGREPAVVEELEELGASGQRTVTDADNRRIDLPGARQR